MACFCQRAGSFHQHVLGYTEGLQHYYFHFYILRKCVLNARNIAGDISGSSAKSASAAGLEKLTFPLEIW